MQPTHLIFRRRRQLAALIVAGLALQGCSSGSDWSESRGLAATDPLAVPVTAAKPDREPLSDTDGTEALEHAIRASLPYLEREGRAWMDGKTAVQDGTGCVSCHQVPFALWGWREAERAGIPADESAWKELESLAHDFSIGTSAGRPGISGPLMLAAGALEDASTTSLNLEDVWRHMLDHQEDDGRWRARGQFPAQRRPILETDAVITQWILLALPPTADPGLEGSRSRALEWLSQQAEGTSTEWLVTSLLLAARAGDTDRAEALERDLGGRQNDDGGWGFLAGDASDAMTTGQVIYALSVLPDSQHEVVSRGVASLLAEQKADGSWAIPSRLFTTEPSAKHDYIYDVWGTAWATIGLSRMVPSQPVILAIRKAVSGTQT